MIYLYLCVNSCLYYGSHIPIWSHQYKSRTMLTGAALIFLLLLSNTCLPSVIKNSKFHLEYRTCNIITKATTAMVISWHNMHERFIWRPKFVQFRLCPLRCKLTGKALILILFWLSLLFIFDILEIVFLNFKF